MKRFTSLVKTCLLVLIISVPATLLIPPASAQSIFANLSGTVTDTSGAVVPGAKVTLQNTGTKVVRQLTANSDGYFSATQLPTGTYNVTAEAKGFEKYQATGIVLNSSDQKNLNINLRVGAESETIEVSAAAGEVAITDSGEKSDLISSKDLNDLSLVGRNATEYLKILPGAALSANGGVNKLAYSGEVVGINGFAVGNNAGGLAGVSVNGQTGQGIAITQDGQNVFDPGAAGAATPVNPNPDMISEVKVLTSNFSSENMKGPIVVNTVTKSGSNTFHGDVHFYARNSAMNAEDSYNKAIESDPSNGFTPGQLKGPSSYYYPGFSIGGPVIIPGTNFNKSRRKVFFFDSYENYHQGIDGGVNRAFVPTTAMLNGDFSALSQTPYKSVGRFALNSIPTAPAAGTFFGFDDRAAAGCTISGAGVMSAGCVDPNAQLLLQNYFPAPTSSVPDANGFNYVAVVTEQQNSWQNVARGDVNISDMTKVYVSWSRQRETANMPLGLWNNSGDWVVPAPSATIGANGSDFTAANFVHVFSPTLTAEARFGYTKINFPSDPATPSKILRKDMNFPLTGVFGNSNAPAVLSWGQSIPNLGDVGHDYHPTMIAVKGIPSVAGDVTKVFKTHTMKYGFYWEHTYNKQDNWGQFMGVLAYDPWTNITGNNYADMLMGITGQEGYFEQALPPPTNLAQNIASFYAQDHWRLTRRITVDYGMRFEHYAKPYANNPWGIAVFDPTAYSASVQNSGIEWHSIDHNIPLSGADSRALFFSPRVGAAIDLFGNGKTVVRGGWGKFRAYDSVQSNSYTGPAQTSQGSVGWSCGFNVQNCATWEMLDTHASGNCTATAVGTAPANCAPAVVFGQEVNFTNSSFSAMNPGNDEQPLVTSYSLTINQQLPHKFRMELSYVGNHTDYMQGTVNINAVPLGTLNAPGFTCKQGSGPTDAYCQQAYRPYSNYQNITQSVTAGKSQYDALQTSVTRNVGLLTLQANYTWAKALGDGVQVNNGGLSGALPDWGVHEYWSVLPLDRAHVFTAAYVLNMPRLHSGSSFVRGLANGWQISGITQVESGGQVTAAGGGAGGNGGNTSLNFGLTGTSSNVALLGTPDINLYTNITCNPRQGLAKNQFVNPNCFALPGPGDIGDGRIPYLPGPMFWNSDLTLLKSFKITERQNLEFRVAAFNFLNHDLLSFNNGDNNLKLSYSNGVLSNATDPNHACPGISCQAFGYANYHYGHRILELGAKYSF
ncbi:MAG TPA: carboxypeptidase regulatory-like domain-containing protein [Candidatus Eisenbacteria bacterium]|nr:carboxypeptidase regulatory-like domain-containing protein [Candidatus Eisenbacteria bacterium]